MNKRGIVALFKAIKVLQNEADQLRAERAVLMLMATFTESQAKKAVEYLNAELALNK